LAKHFAKFTSAIMKGEINMSKYDKILLCMTGATFITLIALYKKFLDRLEDNLEEM